MMRILEDFLKPTQKELFSRLCKMYPNAAARDGEYILVPGEAPVLLVAHLDTVHKSPVRQICKTSNGNILMSPQGIGGVGAYTFCKDYRAGVFTKGLGTMKMLVEIDRKGRTDAVYYECDNPDFEQYINSKGFVTQYGSFSDISRLAPELGVAAVNLSSGYYNAHTQHEYINRKHLNETVRKVVEIIADTVQTGFPAYAYLEKDWGYADEDEYADAFLWDCHPSKKSAKGKKKAPAKAGDDWDNPDLKGVPEEIRHEFEALLELYSPEELNAVREEHGDWAIRSLYDSEVSQFYADIPTPDELDSDIPDIRMKV